MEVSIRYCRTCGFREPAEAIAESLRSEFGLEPRLEEGFWGTFQIRHDGVEVFNRWKTRGVWGRLGLGRTPDPSEVVTIFARRLNSVDQETAGRPAEYESNSR